jgi:hypothetical protein
MLKPLLLSLLLFIPVTAMALQTHDGHIHYNEDIWQDLAPEHAMELLDDNQINRAIVFSTPAEGTKKLYRLAPERIIPFLRPYRVFRDRFSWHSDEDMLAYVTREIETGFYQGFGEFHLFKEHRNTPVVQQMMRVVAKHHLAVNAHADGETIEALINMQPRVVMIWAHCGMKHPIEDVERMLRQYPSLHCELSFRNNLTDEDNNITPRWKTLLEKYPRRFMVGMDTYIARRWAHLPQLKERAVSWLSQLDDDAARLIGGGNIDRLFPAR